MSAKHRSGEAELKPERRTFKHLVGLLSDFNLVEIGKIIRRRFLNSVKYFFQVMRKVLGLIIDYPPIKYRREQRSLNKILLNYFGYSEEQQDDDSKLHIALIIREGKTAPKSSAFIRLIAPLTHESIKDKVSFRIFNENTTVLDGNFDFCIVQRTAFDTLGSANELVRNLSIIGTALIVDTDDAFGSIGKGHPEYSTHSRRMAAKNALLNHASQIWVSTSALLESLDISLQKKAVVVPNGLDSRLWRSPSAENKSSKIDELRMVYMGTATHNEDLQVILPALERLNQKYPGTFSLDLVGVTDNVPDRSWLRRIYLKSSLYPEFVDWFVSKKRFDIGLSPLVDSDFNRSKSDIKCLDYLAAGILPVVSNSSAYKSAVLNNCVVRVKREDEWYETLEDFITQKVSRSEINRKIKEGQKYIWNKRSSKNTAIIIQEQLRSLY